MPTWDNLNEAFEYLRRYIGDKKPDKKFNLSELDLVLVRNFKAGNASVVEPIEHLPTKLPIYSQGLQSLNDLIAERPLRDIDSQLPDLQHQAANFLLLSKSHETRIKGFGAAKSSALLAAYFPETLPVVDRLVLLGAEIQHDLDTQGQVIAIETHYPSLISRCRSALINKPGLSLRQLDKQWFELGQTKSKQSPATT